MSPGAGRYRDVEKTASTKNSVFRNVAKLSGGAFFKRLPAEQPVAFNRSRSGRSRNVSRPNTDRNCLVVK